MAPGLEVERQRLVNIEMKDVGDLEVGAIHEHQVAADYDVRVIRRRRRKHYFEFMRAGPHLSPHIHWHKPANYDLALHSGRKTVAIGQAGRKMLVVRAIPAAGGVAIVIGIAAVVMFAVVFAVMFAIVAAFMIVAVPMLIVITVVFLVAVIVVVLRE